MEKQGKVVIVFDSGGMSSVTVEGNMAVPPGRFEAALPRIYRALAAAKGELLAKAERIAAIKAKAQANKESAHADR